MHQNWSALIIAQSFFLIEYFLQQEVKCSDKPYYNHMDAKMTFNGDTKHLILTLQEWPKM